MGESRQVLFEIFNEQAIKSGIVGGAKVMVDVSVTYKAVFTTIYVSITYVTQSCA